MRKPYFGDFQKEFIKNAKLRNYVYFIITGLAVGRRSWETRQDRGKDAAMDRDLLDDKPAPGCCLTSGSNSSSFSRTAKIYFNKC